MTTRGLILATMVAPARLAAAEGACAAPVLSVANRPIVAYALDAMRRAGIADVGIAVSDTARASMREVVGDGDGFGVRLTYLDAGAATGLGAAVLACRDYLEDAPFVAQVGAGMLRDELTPLLAIIEDGTDALALSHIPVPGASARALAGHRLLRALGSPGGDHERLALAGACVFGAGALTRLDARRDGGAPALPELGLGGLLERLRAAGGRVVMRRAGDWRSFGGAVEDLLEMNRLVLDDLRDEPVREFPDTRVEGRVSIDPTARVRSAILRGPAIIGRGAQVADAYIGPYTAIGAGARIEGAEVEHSMILPGAQILHVGRRLEGSFVGPNARVFRDFSLPQAMRLQVGDGVVVSW